MEVKQKTAVELCVLHLNLSQYVEIERMGHELGSLLYYGDPYPREEGEELFETLEPKFMALFDDLQLPDELWVDMDCEYVSEKEPEFEREFYEEEARECCCEHSRCAFWDGMQDMFYAQWTRVTKKEILIEWLGSSCVEAISYSKFI